MKIGLKKIGITTFGFLCFSCNSFFSNEKFDSTKWKSGNAQIRGRMAHDLEESGILIGKTESEVKEFLGEPDYPTSYTIDRIYSGIFWETHFAVRFDENTNKASSIDIGD